MYGLTSVTCTGGEIESADACGAIAPGIPGGKHVRPADRGFGAMAQREADAAHDGATRFIRALRSAKVSLSNEALPDGYAQLQRRAQSYERVLQSAARSQLATICSGSAPDLMAGTPRKVDRPRSVKMLRPDGVLRRASMLAAHRVPRRRGGRGADDAGVNPCRRTPSHCHRICAGRSTLRA